ncbi:MAG TPA: TonB family protein [Arenimonas sp.]|nr:TonB family protein [Arenimonas sp.]
MSVSASHSRSAYQSADLNVSRIAAISTAVSVHIAAFLFLMAPIALPDRLLQPETVTQVVLHDPPKPKPIVLPPKPLAPKPLETRQMPAPQTLVPHEDRPADTVEATTQDALAGDLYVPIGQVGPGDAIRMDAGGDVDASTRARFPIDYPVAALRAGLTGTVVVLARYDVDGTVMETRVHQTSRSPQLDRAALLGVRKWKITPGKINGQALGGEALVEVVFNL